MSHYQSDKQGVRGPLKPDHGQNFLPGSEAAPGNLAPQPLDHFKRGYKERADLRDRESNPLVATAPEIPKVTPAPATNKNAMSSYKHSESDGYNNNRRNGTGGGIGFDVIRLVDELCRPGCLLTTTLDRAKEQNFSSFASGKALTAILSNLARRRKMGIALSVWQWMDTAGIKKNVFHYNSLISVCEKMKDNNRAMRLMEEMDEKGISKNEVTFSSAISSCEKSGEWRKALDLLERMKKEGVARTAIAYNAAISACEKGLVPHKALEIFDQMKREGVTPTVITYSAMISAAEKGQQWKLALEVLEEMKAVGHGANVIAYSAAISALSKGQMWEKALELFREIERFGNAPSIVTYNATMSALEKGLQWERALDLFDEMKMKGLPITVVSYGSAISACEKGLQYKQCLEFLDEMTEIGIKKNVVIFGAAMSCMEKSCRADIAFQLMDRMKIEGVPPNVHIFNSAISACARCNLWEKGYELFQEMEVVGVVKDVVSYNAVLDAVSTQVPLARKLFKEGVERGFYARVSRLGTQWLELDLHFLSLGGGEIALGWWFEDCLVPYLVNSSKLVAVKSIDIVTGYGKTRMRGVRHGDDGMRKRVKAMLHFMEITEVEQPNKGRIHIDKEALVLTVQRNGGRIIFDEEGYRKFKLESTTAAHIPDVEQKVRPKVKPAGPVGDMPRRCKNESNDGYGRNSNRRGTDDDSRGRYGSDFVEKESDRWESERSSRHVDNDHDRRQGHHGLSRERLGNSNYDRPDDFESRFSLNDGRSRGPTGGYNDKTSAYPRTSTMEPNSNGVNRDRFDNISQEERERPGREEEYCNGRNSTDGKRYSQQRNSYSMRDKPDESSQRDSYQPTFDSDDGKYASSNPHNYVRSHNMDRSRHDYNDSISSRYEASSQNYRVKSRDNENDRPSRQHMDITHFANSSDENRYNDDTEKVNNTHSHHILPRYTSNSHNIEEKSGSYGRHESHEHLSSEHSKYRRSEAFADNGRSHIGRSSHDSRYAHSSHRDGRKGSQSRYEGDNQHDGVNQYSNTSQRVDDKSGDYGSHILHKHNSSASSNYRSGDAHVQNDSRHVGRSSDDSHYGHSSRRDERKDSYSRYDDVHGYSVKNQSNGISNCRIDGDEHSRDFRARSRSRDRHNGKRVVERSFDGNTRDFSAEKYRPHHDITRMESYGSNTGSSNRRY